MLDDVKKYYLYRSFNKRLAMPVWFLFMIDHGLSVQQIAFVAGASTVISFILEIPSGSFADTIGHRKALILGALGQGAGLALFVGGNFWWILAGSLTYWSVGTLMTGTHQAFLFEKLVELGRKDEFQKLMGRARSVSATFSAIAVSTAGFMYAISPGLPFIASAAIYWLGAITAFTFNPTKYSLSVEKQEGFKTWINHFKQSWRTITQSSQLFWLSAFNALLVGISVAAAEMQQIILNNIGLAVAAFGILYAIKRLFSATMAPFLHRLRPILSPVRIMSVMSLSLVLYLFLMSIVQSHVLMFGVVLLASAVIVINDIIINDIKNQLIPTGSRATTLSMTNFAEGVIKLVGLGFFGLATLVIPIEQTHLVLAILLLIFSPFFLKKIQTTFIP